MPTYSDLTSNNTFNDLRIRVNTIGNDFEILAANNVPFTPGLVNANTVQGAIELLNTEVDSTRNSANTRLNAAESSITTLTNTKQNLNAKLTAISNLSLSANTLIVATSANTFVTQQVSNFARTTFDDPNAVTFRATIGAVNIAGDTLTGALNFAPSASIASATTTNLSTVNSNYVTVTGTTTITALGTLASGSVRFVRFTDALILTHNATSLILPNNLNINTTAGDVVVFISEGSGNWRCINYFRANGRPIIPTFTQGYVYFMGAR